MKAKKILCVYATRQIDSNLFMASTVFRGLKEAGYEVYLAFAGFKDVIEDFKKNYSHYFRDVHYHEIAKSHMYRLACKSPASKLVYSFYRHFVADGLLHLPTNGLKSFLQGKNFDCILSFIPPVMSGFYAANTLHNNALWTGGGKTALDSILD